MITSQFLILQKIIIKHKSCAIIIAITDYGDNKNLRWCHSCMPQIKSLHRLTLLATLFTSCGFIKWISWNQFTIFCCFVFYFLKYHLGGSLGIDDAARRVAFGAEIIEFKNWVGKKRWLLWITLLQHYAHCFSHPFFLGSWYRG